MSAKKNSQIEQVGLRILRARKKLGLAQGVFGAKAGVSQTVMSTIERGEGGCTLENLTALIHAHRLCSDFVIFGVGPMFEGVASWNGNAVDLLEKMQEVADGTPSLLSLLKDEDAVTVCRVGYDEVVELKRFFQKNVTLGEYMSQGGVLDILRVLRAEKVSAVEDAIHIIRSKTK